MPQHPTIRQRVKDNLTMYYHRWRYWWEQRQGLRQLERDAYHLKELAATDPDDPRVLLSQQAGFFDPHPMQMDRETAAQLLAICRQEDDEINSPERFAKVARIKALAALDPDDPRVLLGDKHFIGPDPMSLTKAQAQAMLNEMNEAEIEVRQIDAELNAGLRQLLPRRRPPYHK